MTIGPTHVDPETIQMPVWPVEPIAAVRHAIRAAIGDVWGAENVPESADGYRPHVSLGCSNSEGPGEPVTDALAQHGEHIAEVMASAVNIHPPLVALGWRACWVV